MFSITNQLFNNCCSSRIAFKLLKRYKLKKAKNVCAAALDHFDDFYKNIFSKNWPSVRLGLLSKQKYVAVVNNFGDTAETEKLLKENGALNFKTYLEIQKNQPITPESQSYEKDGEISNTILSKMKEEEEKELGYIYPNSKEISSKARFIDKEDDEHKEHTEEDNYFYDPDEASTSLHSDLSFAEFETDRLILPDSNVNMASLYEFVPVTELRGLNSYISESEYYKYYKVKSDQEISIDPEFTLDFPEDLKVFTFDRGDTTELPMPKRCANDVYNFLPVDGAEVLAALALGVESGDKVLNISSTTAGMGYCIFQSLRAKNLVCCYSDNFDNIFQNHLYDYSPNWKDMLYISKKRFDKLPYQSMDLFDKILLNVPCTDDRLSLFEEDDNIFCPSKIKMRLSIPEQQTLVLTNALKMIRPGGTVLYTTSTLSPVQNDGVVSEALKMAWEESKIKFTVKDLSSALAHTSIFYNFGKYLKLKFGTLVVPFVPSNFGPRYFCKIVRNE